MGAEEKRQVSQITIRLTPAELDSLRVQARQRGYLKLASYCRYLIEADKRTLRLGEAREAAG